MKRHYSDPLHRPRGDSTPQDELENTGRTTNDTSKPTRYLGRIRDADWIRFS